ncbi:flap endonuclease-1 [Candidatus Woesearchaeota archaeon]|nr:flap endonuclease-1 [Candidatus Woesearchaeota archaeon]
MGINLRDIVIKKEITIEDLKGKRLVVDTFNMLYQFLATIRMRDGSLLMDSKGNVTSHLTGLFSRTTNLMQRGLKLAFVLDGEAPELKKRERQRRKEAKLRAQQEYTAAKEREDIAEMQKYAARTSVLTPEMVVEARKLLEALGLPVIQAPSEGEAQAAYMVNHGDAYAEVSQDFDCLLFGVPRLVRNLSISERKKLPGKLAYQTVKPEFIELHENLKSWGIHQDQLIALGMLVGTDFNPDGVKGIGQKNALKLVKEYKTDFDALFSKVEWDKHFPFPWQEVFDLLKHMPVTKEYSLKWKEPDRDKIIKLLCDEHDFSYERVSSTLENLQAAKSKHQQKGLGDFI